jgi:hypothetical protein
MLGILAAFHEDSDLSPAESMFGSQLVLLGQFVDTAESSSSSFLVQTAMAGRSPLPTLHNFSPAMTSLPELLLLACFVLVHIDCAQLPVTLLYDRPFSVLEWPRHFFFLKIGDWTHKVSMLHLKLAWTLADKEQVPLVMRSQWIFSDGAAAAIMPRRGKHAHLRQPAHHLPSGGWSSLDGRQFQQGFAILWYPHRCWRLFSSPYTPSTTQRCRRRGASSQPDFAGHKQIKLLACPPPPPALLWPHPSRWPEAIPSPPSLLLTVTEPCSPAGSAESPVLECLPSSHLTERLNSHLHYGQPSSTCTTSATPQQQHTTHKSNRLVEHFHRRLKNALCTKAATANWCDHLPWVMLGILVAFHEDNVFSPAKSMFGSQVFLLGQFVDTAESPSSSFQVQTTMAGRSPLPTLHNFSSAIARACQSCCC